MAVIPPAREAIIAWGQENGYPDLSPEDRLPTGLRAAYEEAMEDTPKPRMTIPIRPGVRPDDREDFEGIAGLKMPSTDEITEIPPTIRIPRENKVGKIRDRIRKAAPPTAKPRGRKPLKPRVSVEKLISMGWRALANMTAPVNMPVARMLDMQAPVAGMVLEDTIKETLLDRLLQPLARAEKGGETVFALIGPPLLVAAITAKPQLYPALRAPLKEALAMWVDIAGDKLEQVRKREADFEEKYGRSIDDMINMVFDTDMNPMETPTHVS
jgi:hypothetical protein